MSKELEAWEKIKLGYICGQGAINEFALRENERENFKIIEKALKEQEELEKSLKSEIEHSAFLNRERLKDSKKLKALEIIKEIAKTYDIEFCDSKQTISFKIMLKDKFILETIAIKDKEEYELVKEVLL